MEYTSRIVDFCVTVLSAVKKAIYFFYVDIREMPYSNDFILVSLKELLVLS